AEPRMSATGYEQPDPRPGAESVGHRVEFDADRTRLRCGGQTSVSVADIVRSATGIDLAHPHEHVDVRDVRGVRKLDDRVARDVQIRGQGVAREAEYVWSTGQPAVVAVSALRGQQGSTDDRRRLRRVIGETRRACLVGPRSIRQGPARLQM